MTEEQLARLRRQDIAKEIHDLLAPKVTLSDDACVMISVDGAIVILDGAPTEYCDVENPRVILAEVRKEKVYHEGN